MKTDAIPEPVDYERSRRATTEFCTQLDGSHRCMLVKGHPGAHEAICTRGVRRWRSTSTIDISTAEVDSD